MRPNTTNTYEAVAEDALKQTEAQMVMSPAESMDNAIDSIDDIITELTCVVERVEGGGHIEQDVGEQNVKITPVLLNILNQGPNRIREKRETILLLVGRLRDMLL